MTLLTRMQTSKTDKYVYNFVYFATFTMAINVGGLTPDVFIGVFESIQPRRVFDYSLIPAILLTISQQPMVASLDKLCHPTSTSDAAEG